MGSPSLHWHYSTVQPSRRALLQRVSTAALGLATACGRVRPVQQPPAGGIALHMDVTVTFMSTSGQVERELIDQLIQRWQTAHPSGPRAQFLLATGNVVEKFLPMLTSGTPPELVSMSASEGVVFADGGHFAPLDDRIKRDRYDLSDYIPESLDQYRWKGKLYALLRDFSHQSFYVNLSAFERAGLAPPAGDFSTATGWDWNQFLDDALRFTVRDGSGRVTQYGFVLNTGLRGGYWQWIATNGAELFDRDYTRCTLDDPRAIDALQFMQDLVYRHGVAPDPETQRQTPALAGSQQAFFEGLTAMAIFPIARIGEARQLAKVPWDLAVTPKGQGRRVTTGGGVGWFLVQSAPALEEGWAVLQFLSSPEAHQLVASVRFPGRKSVLDWLLAQEPGLPPKNRAVARTGQLVVRLDPIFPLWNDIEREIFAPQLQALWQNRAAAREVVREIVTQTNRYLAERGRAGR